MTGLDLSHRTFSSAWYRVSEMRCSLRQSVTARKQNFDHETWFVLNDKMSSEWFRVSPDAYHFIATLELDRTVEESWQITLERNPESTLSQEEIVQLLAQLHLSNMLVYDQVTGVNSFFDRMADKKRRERLTYLTAFLSIKIPLFDPNRTLDLALPFVRVMFGPIGICAYLLLMIGASIALSQNVDRLLDDTEGILAPGNLILLYLGFAVSKIVHELGHATLCKFYGGEVHVLGVMLLIFTPIPYVDASASWGFRSRTERFLVASAGVIFELGFAAIALLVWVNTAPGTLNALCHNIIFTASVSTLLFNSNPLLRFDGYHMLVDALNMPNLYANSRNQLKYLASRFLLFAKDAQPAAQSLREAWLLPIYGVLSLGYWLILMVGILTFVANQYLDLGVLMAVLLVIMTFILPFFKFVKYLLVDGSLKGDRHRAIGATLCYVSVLFALLSLVTIGNQVRVQGVVEANESRRIFNDASGLVRMEAPENGTLVHVGTPLLKLEDGELAYSKIVAESKLVQLQGQMRQSVAQSHANISPLERQIAAMQGHLDNLQERQNALNVDAPIEGIWTSSETKSDLGSWVQRGSYIGIITNPEGWRFVGVLSQADSFVFEQQVLGASLKIRGQEDVNIPITKTEIIPFESGTLPSAALGMAGGGEIAVDPNDPQGLTAIEPFFRIEGWLSLEDDTLERISLMHGASGTVQLKLPSERLALQARRRIEQFLQRRFRF